MLKNESWVERGVFFFLLKEPDTTEYKWLTVEVLAAIPCKKIDKILVLKPGLLYEYKKNAAPNYELVVLHRVIEYFFIIFMASFPNCYENKYNL